MSTRPDVRFAAQRYQDHCGAHKCRSGQCSERARLIREWFSIAALWQAEPDDTERYRRQVATN